MYGVRNVFVASVINRATKLSFDGRSLGVWISSYLVSSSYAAPRHNDFQSHHGPVRRQFSFFPFFWSRLILPKYQTIVGNLVISVTKSPVIVCQLKLPMSKKLPNFPRKGGGGRKRNLNQFAYDRWSSLQFIQSLTSATSLPFFLCPTTEVYVTLKSLVCRYSCLIAYVTATI